MMFLMKQLALFIVLYLLTFCEATNTLQFGAAGPSFSAGPNGELVLSASSVHTVSSLCELDVDAGITHASFLIDDIHHIAVNGAIDYVEISNADDTVKVMSALSSFAKDVETAFTTGLVFNLSYTVSTPCNANIAVGWESPLAKSGESGVPVGSILVYAANQVPNTNYMLCDGSALDRVEFSMLYDLIGITYGAPDGSSFNLPDLRGRVVAGHDVLNNAGHLTVVNAAVLGAVGGEETHTLTTDEMPDHSHQHVKYGQTTVTGAYGIPPQGSNNIAQYGTTTGAGGSQPHNNIQPTIVCNYIIKVK